MKELTERQLESLTPEARRRYEVKLKKVKRNRKILTGSIAVIAIVAVAAVLSITVFFNVANLKVAKVGSHYDAQQILDAAGVEVGDNMLLTDWKEVKQKVERKLPYVLSLEINKTIGGNITFTVKDNKASMLFKTNGGYAVADANGKVLEIIKDKPKNSGLMLLKTKKGVSADVGELMNFNDDSEKELYDNVCSAIKESGIRSITGIDITDKDNIYIEYQSRFRLYIGDSSQLVYKLREAKKVIAQEDETNPKQIGEINLSILKKVYVEPLDTLEPTVPTTTQPETTQPDGDEPVSNDDDGDSSNEDTTGETEIQPEEDTTEPDDENPDDSDDGEE